MLAITYKAAYNMLSDERFCWLKGSFTIRHDLGQSLEMRTSEALRYIDIWTYEHMDIWSDTSRSCPTRPLSIK